MDLALDRDSTQACFEAGLLDSLKAGTTTIIDHHCSPSYIEGSLSLLAETSEKLGLNISTAFEISDRNGHEKIEASLQENIDAIKKFSGTPHVHPMLGLHASFTLSEKERRVFVVLYEADTGDLLSVKEIMARTEKDNDEVDTVGKDVVSRLVKKLVDNNPPFAERPKPKDGVRLTVEGRKYWKTRERDY